METYKVIADIDELKWFYDNVLVKPTEGESYMICHSARVKKLTNEEKEQFGSKRAEMFHTEISKVHVNEEYRWIDFLSCVSKLEVNKMAYLTNKKVPYPDKCLVTYIYMNPSSEASVAQDTLERINVINKDLIFSGIKGSSKGIKDSVWKLSTISNHIKACHAQNPSRKVYIDFDIDCENLTDESIKALLKINVEFFDTKGYLIKTAGGVHVLIPHDNMKCNPNNYLTRVQNELGYCKIKEAKLNSNCMIPLPGTYQYGNIVRILNK